MNGQERHENHRLIPLYLLLLFAAFGVFYALGFLASQAVFLVTGEPPEIVAHISSGMLGLSFFIAAMSLIRLVFEIYIKRHPESKFNYSKFGRENVLQSTLDAMNRLSNGDFNVLLQVDERNPHSEIVEGFNKMVKNLGSLENMRQDFISNVSHEIQSPLTSIKGFAALLKSDSITGEERKHYADIIESESRRMSAMSENLLKLSALDSGNEPLNKTEFRLDKQLQSVVLASEPQWSAKNITIDIDAGKATVIADADLLAQVWTNLLSNAVKFTPDGGTVFITLKDNAVTVKDTGIGISESDLVRIFERFYKADKSRDRALGGNGLGLAIAKKILDLHGFTITAASEVGQGTQFTVRLHSI